MRIGVDTGGTFTDFVVEKEGGLRFHKVVSTPHNPAEAVCRGIDELGESLYPGDEVIHGTTVATNGFLERKGARTALITTRGFRDLLCIGRQNRPELYNLQVKKVAPFIRPSWVFEVNERTLADGTLVRKPENGHLGKLQHKLIQGRFESIAVVFLHSYVNPTNEELVGAGLQDLGLPVSLSSKILPEFREYERLSTTCINAYLGPLLSHYFRELEQRLRPVVLLVQQSNGGHMTVPEAAERPVHTILSGPAGGLAGARKIADFLGEPRIITFDMGGTSTDVALSDGDLPYTREYRLDDFPVGVQVLDIHTIGAGGENLVKFALGSVDKRSSLGRGGGAAVMGSKNLKAVVARAGKKGVKVADPEKFMRVVNELYKPMVEDPLREAWREHGVLIGWPNWAKGGFACRNSSEYAPEEKVAPLVTQLYKLKMQSGETY